MVRSIDWRPRDRYLYGTFFAMEHVLGRRRLDRVLGRQREKLQDRTTVFAVALLLVLASSGVYAKSCLRTGGSQSG